MRNFNKKSALSLLLAFVILFTSVNFVFAADNVRIIEAPQELRDTVRYLQSLPESEYNELSEPDPGSAYNFYERNKFRQPEKNINLFGLDIEVDFGAELPSADNDNEPKTWWIGDNNNPTRVSATVNGDPRTSIGFNWYSSKAAESYALISKSPDMNDATKYEAVLQPVTSRFFKRNQDGTFYVDDRGYFYYDDREEYIYKAKVNNLEPNTTYYYQVGSDATGMSYSPVGTFKTAGNKGQDFSFIHITDTQNAYYNQFDMDEAWYGASTLEEALKIDPDMDFIVHTGDIVEYSESEDEWVDILEQSKKSIMSKMLVPASGNHDELGLDRKYTRTQDFNRHFNVPVTNGISGGSYYSYDYNGVHFIVANTNDFKTDGKMIGPEQREWIKEDVKKARDNGAEWVILAYHKPLYSKSYHSLSDRDILAVKQEMMEFIDEYNIDLCMQGHDHVLARTKSLKFTQEHPNVYAEIADNGVDGENKLYKDTPGTIFVLPNMAGTKAYDDFYSKGLEHTKNMRRNLSWMTQEDLDHYNSLFALGGQPAIPKEYKEDYSNDRDSTIQNFAHYSFENGDLRVKMYQVEGEKGSERTTKVIDEFVLSKTKYYDVNFEVDSNKGEVEGEVKHTKVKEDTSANTLAPKVTGINGYKFVDWSPKVDDKINENITFTAIFEKEEKVEPKPTPKPIDPIKPIDPVKPVDPVKPIDPVRPADPRPNYNSSSDGYNPMIAYFMNNLGKDPAITTPSNRPVAEPTIQKPVISDIAGHWAEGPITRVVEKGYMDLDNGKFMPNIDASRLTYVNALAKMAGVNPADYMNKTVFSDVVAGTKDAGYINWAYEKGIVKGTDEGKFEGAREISRQEIATILNRYEKAMDLNLSKNEVEKFADDEKIADWAKADVLEARAKGIFSGKDNNMFDPLANITRAEVAQVVVNIDR